MFVDKLDYSIILRNLNQMFGRERVTRTFARVKNNVGRAKDYNQNSNQLFTMQNVSAESVCVCERERMCAWNRERTIVCVFVCVWERENVPVYVGLSVCLCFVFRSNEHLSRCSLSFSSLTPFFSSRKFSGLFQKQVFFMTKIYLRSDLLKNYGFT